LDVTDQEGRRATDGEAPGLRHVLTNCFGDLPRQTFRHEVNVEAQDSRFRQQVWRIDVALISKEFRSHLPELALSAAALGSFRGLKGQRMGAFKRQILGN
jgi:hypothetical protein